MTVSTMDKHILAMSSTGRIQLFAVDLSHIDGPVLRFTPNQEVINPETVVQLEDNTTGRGRITLDDLTPFLDDGDEVVVEFFVRDQSGEGSIFEFGFFDENYIHTRNLSAHVVADLSIMGVTLGPSGQTKGTPHAADVTLAGEWTYVSARFTVAEVAGTVFKIEPATGAAGTTDILTTAVGVKHFFGLRAWRMYGGVRVPLVGFGKMLDWSEWNNIIVSEVSSTHEVVKVPVFGGNTYTPLPIKAEGFEVSGQGRMPTPRLSMSNITGAGTQLMQQYGDVRGAVVTRTLMYAENLDNGINPDPLATYTPEVYILDRMASQNHELIEFDLSSRLDQQGVQLPRRQILRDVCPWKYRSWNGSSFDYADDEEGCPYSGSSYFDINGNTVTDPAEDKCSQKLATGCRMRYGTDETLPFGGFPMVGRFRT